MSQHSVEGKAKEWAGRPSFCDLGELGLTRVHYTSRKTALASTGSWQGPGGRLGQSGAEDVETEVFKTRGSCRKGMGRTPGASWALQRVGVF